jgi:hypothetical protein
MIRLLRQDLLDKERVAHPRRSRKAKTRNRKAVLPELLGVPGQNPIRKV